MCIIEIGDGGIIPLAGWDEGLPIVADSALLSEIFRSTEIIAFLDLNACAPS